MDGLDAAARRLVRERNVPEELDREFGPSHALVFEDDGLLVGVGALSGDEIRRLYVHPDAQGAGVGSALLTALEQAARAAGRTSLRLDASPSSVGFYVRHGYLPREMKELRAGRATFIVVPMTKDN